MYIWSKCQGKGRKYKYLDLKISNSNIDGIVIDNNGRVKFKSNMFDEFKNFCKQENYIYELLSIDADYAICNVNHSIMLHFIKCMQSENEETIKMLCMLPKEILVNRANGKFCGVDWVHRTDLKFVKEAIKRYDEPIYVKERNKMAEYL